MKFEKRIIRTSPVVGCRCALVIGGAQHLSVCPNYRILKDPLAICSRPKELIALKTNYQTERSDLIGVVKHDLKLTFRCSACQ